VEKETSKDLASTSPQANGPEGQEPRVNGKSARVRTASKEQFEKAQRKTSATHAGLFRRLAK
jgi:hypothetical protein